MTPIGSYTVLAITTGLLTFVVALITAGIWLIEEWQARRNNENSI